jgi:hypothetical protein
VHRVKRLRLVFGDAHAPLRNDAKPGLLDHGVDRAGQIAGDGIGFDDRKGTLDRHSSGFLGEKKRMRAKAARRVGGL